MAAWGGIMDKKWSYMLRIEVTSKSNTFNRTELTQNRLSHKKEIPSVIGKIKDRSSCGM